VVFVDCHLPEAMGIAMVPTIQAVEITISGSDRQLSSASFEGYRAIPFASLRIALQGKYH
jgi:hypothetical protein